ncbi:TIGR04283 family arsenosugar biosynthesis glycosyltransferase [Hahella aquimaris]|uniref:TIGR04283 family arsenosugar biosynthesis glycosyltransferase n=1 Tax=Hahella sp. HNIBRBA332 TaxID=3015983 RepID=UPI00273B81CE|nr:TIGR04283 family arsenosugar biosynthesis glycosyltransferase [Hahella sp. HNIBRBA332]WLQ15002.1 TIGR04283 family arsenosugar biosynthesis glycosyltransferase [Hahella sp. HNIBRBA332]
MSIPVSVIIPTLNEAESISAFLRVLQPLREAGWELILSDGGSRDETVSLAEPRVDKIIVSTPGRAAQMNNGAESASGEVLLFLHADTQLPQDAVAQLTAFVASNADWGRFDVRLSGRRFMFRVVETLINLRSRITSVATGDQAIFIRKAAFQRLGGYARIPLMEDVEICKRLRRQSKPYCIRARVITSSRRWEVHGVWKTIFLMWRLRFEYWLGVAPDKLFRRYYGRPGNV